MTHQNSKSHVDDEIEELTQVTEALRITREIICRPFAFARHREPRKMREARSYLLFGLLLAVGIAVFIAWLNGNIAAKTSFEAHSSHVMVQGEVDPKFLDIETELRATALFIVIAASGRVLHYVLSRITRRQVSPGRSTAAILYWLGFAFVSISITVLWMSLATRFLITHPLPDAWGDAALFVLLFLPMLYVIGMVIGTLCEWTRRLYALRAWSFYLVVVLLLVATSVVQNL